ncbi:hypothetical protein FRX31_008998 [Thalictrum thalictroides]|uniref:Uncharacterized protein n=1 Tax=Thalictrum thalictroides TaxID=46969 RepID=A0A7J6WVK7_THATH|nr:hypothetical protein FRX31_008998 [Thalictrum thalictroides]
MLSFYSLNIAESGSKTIPLHRDVYANGTFVPKCHGLPTHDLEKGISTDEINRESPGEEFRNMIHKYQPDYVCGKFYEWCLKLPFCKMVFEFQGIRFNHSIMTILSRLCG